MSSHSTTVVAVRIRPLNTISESSPNNDNEKSKEKTAWALEKSGAMDTLVQKGMTLKVDGKSVFRFDSVFDEDTQTPLVYKSMARGMVKTVLCESYRVPENISHHVMLTC